MDWLKDLFERIKQFFAGGGQNQTDGQDRHRGMPSDAELAARNRSYYAARARGRAGARPAEHAARPAASAGPAQAEPEVPGKPEPPVKPESAELPAAPVAAASVPPARVAEQPKQDPAKQEGEGFQGYAIDERAKAARLAMRSSLPDGSGDGQMQQTRAMRAASAIRQRWAVMTGQIPRVTPVEPQMKRERRSFFVPREKAPNAIFGVAFTTLQLLVYTVLVLGVAGGGAVVGIAKAYMDTTPVLDTAKIQNQDLTSFIYDSKNNLITTFVGMENREWASLDEIPLNMQHAIVSIEDSRFYQHNGVDLKRIVGAFLSNMSSGASQGGSTITQQLVKNTMGSMDRTYKRKIQEAWLAMQLEEQYRSKYPKEYKGMILAAYLNTIPLGESDYGVKAAAKDYFGKSLDQLTLRECAMLAGLTQSPYLYDPRLNTFTRHRMEVTDKRTNTVLLCMYQQGYIDKGQYEQALAEKVTILEKSAKTQMYDMPYFVEYAIEDIKTHLLKARNLEDTPENRSKLDSELRTSGYKIYLTVDPDIQKTVEDTLYNWSKYPKMQLSTYNTYNSIPQPQAAAVVLDYHTGQLKAVVGGRSQPTAKRTLNRAYQAHMPVGSTMKPIAVYGPAIDLGASPASVIENIPSPITGWKDSKVNDTYPGNYSGDPFTGPISLREGLVHSYNVVAAHVLMDDVGLDTSVSYLQKLGVKSQINKDGPGLALGTTGLTPVEMSAAYGAFGNKGQYIEPLSFTKIVDGNGKVVLDAEQVRVKTQVFKPSTAWMMLDMMKDVVSRGTGTKAKIKGMTVAGKTGTNSNYVGVSFCALTPYYSSDIWVGSDGYKPLYKGATGGAVAAPIWQSYMSKIVTQQGQKNKDILDDSAASLGLVKATVCGVSGDLPTDACALDKQYPTVSDWFLQGTQPTQTCQMHFAVTLDKTTGKVATPFTPLDQTEPGCLLFLPQDSPIRKLQPADLLKYFPSSVPELTSLENLATEFTYDNPVYAKYFDPIHNQDWADMQAKWNTLTGQANALIADVKLKMASYGVSLEVQNTLNAKIKAIQDIETKGFTDPAVPAQTVYDNLQTAYQDLQNYAAMALVEPTAEPSASPSPTPSATPAG